MLFYTSIFVASLIATLPAIFFYEAIENKVRSVNTTYQRITITDSSRNYQREGTGFKTCNGIPTQPVPEDGMVYSNLGGMPRDKSVDCHNLDTFWLIRENRLLSMYESYTASLTAELEPRTFEMVSKPFRRKVAL